MFRNSALNKSIYSEHDTPYFTNELVKPNAKEQVEFIGRVLEETPSLSEEKITKEFEIFYTMCRLVDGGNNIEVVIDLFKRKFLSLSKNQISHWANGFSVLPKLYNHMLLRMENKLQEISNDQNQSRIVKRATEFAFNKLEDLKRLPSRN
jgi:Leucine-rich repeat (LRR) protein